MRSGWILVIALMGCGGVPATVPASGDGGQGGGGRDAAPETTADVQPPPCNTLAEDAPLVLTQQKLSQPPAPLGGTIVPGTYVLTAIAVYLGGTTIADGTGGTMVITPTTIEWVATALVLNKVLAVHSSSSWSAQGTTMTLEQSCPSSETSTAGYTAKDKTLTLYWSSPDLGTTEQVYTLK